MLDQSCFIRQFGTMSKIIASSSEDGEVKFSDDFLEQLFGDVNIAEEIPGQLTHRHN